MHNAIMPNVIVRDLPEDVHAELVRRADVAGQSLQQYLSSELTRITSVPTVDEVLSRVARRRGGRVGLRQAVADLESGRSAR